MLKPALQAACRAKVEELARESGDGGPALLIGTPWVEDGKLYNAYCLLDRRRHRRRAAARSNLPNYGVFDEKRVFAPGPLPGPVNFRGVRIGLPICEDIWTEWGDYEDVVECLAETGAELLIVPNGSPYWRDKDEVRLNIAVARVTESDLPLVYVNQVGGQDELVFDGASFGLQRRPLARLPAAGLPRSRVDDGVRRAPATAGAASAVRSPQLEEGDKADYVACMLGLRDYVNKNGFKGVVLGLSGGIDSALVRGAGGRCARRRARALRDAALPLHVAGVARRCRRGRAGARRALRHGADRERGAGPREGARAGSSTGLPRDVTEENLQARARGTILMAISNKFGLMVVTTGNKSEMSVGYATLYGDMNGGFNPIKDLYKTEVYRLARLRNRWKPDDALGPARRGDPRKHHHARADRRAAREPDRPGLAAALRRARPHPRAPGRARGADRDDRRRPASTARR